METIAAYILTLMKQKGFSQRDLALTAGMNYQNLSAALKGRRALPVRTSLRIDKALGLREGTIARMQTEETITKEIRRMKDMDRHRADRHEILRKIKKNGGLWSYNAVPESLPDDDVIEEALRHLDFEDMHLVFEIWSKARVKRIWKERLVPEGSRMNVLNTLLGILFFDIRNINKYYYGNGNQN